MGVQSGKYPHPWPDGVDEYPPDTPGKQCSRCTARINYAAMHHKTFGSLLGKAGTTFEQLGLSNQSLDGKRLASKYDLTLQVTGAGNEAANGLYHINLKYWWGKPQWAKADGSASIWWDEQDSAWRLGPPTSVLGWYRTPHGLLTNQDCKSPAECKWVLVNREWLLFEGGAPVPPAPAVTTSPAQSSGDLTIIWEYTASEVSVCDGFSIGGEGRARDKDGKQGKGSLGYTRQITTKQGSALVKWFRLPSMGKDAPHLELCPECAFKDLTPPIMLSICRQIDGKAFVVPSSYTRCTGDIANRQQ